MHVGLFNNSLLRHMDADVLSRLQLRRVDLPVRTDLEVPGNQIDHLFFIEKGIGSMTTLFENGVQVETSMFGYESVVGLSALMGVRKSINRIFMQLSGFGFACPVGAAEAEFNRNGIFQKLTLRYVQAQLTLSTQNAACNATHTYEQRLARWLLICADRAREDTLELAQEFVSEMLGSTRSTVSIAAARLKAKGVIEYRRGTIVLLKKKELEQEACECYRVVREHLETLTNFESGLT
jgi:CRP-like cAMP-binding protein